VNEIKGFMQIPHYPSVFPKPKVAVFQEVASLNREDADGAQGREAKSVCAPTPITVNK
jgi:hypothetical protein